MLTALSGVGGIGFHPFALCVCSSGDFRGKSYGRLPSYCPAGTMTLDWMNACALVLIFVRYFMSEVDILNALCVDTKTVQDLESH